MSPTAARHVSLPPSDDLMILDGGPCPVGIESTIIDCSGPDLAMLRPGSVTAADIMQRTGLEVHDLTADPKTADTTPTAPGQLQRHYAPQTPLRLEARHVDAAEALLAFGTAVPEGALATENLSPSGDLREAAANLFSLLHRLDGLGARAIAVMPVPDEDLGRAINDRLRRAAGAQ